jgi:hypothetical protein
MTETFIEKARLVHGDKYDYSKTEYKNCKSNVTIICKLHGEIEQKPNHHLGGNGCKKCGKEKTLNSQKSNKIEFVKKATQVHGEIYDYSLVEYAGCYTKIKIICKIHGQFEQTPTIHLNTKGCKKCSGIYKKTLEDFKTLSKKKYPDKFCYEETIYKTCKDKVILKCIKHNHKFEITPDSHLNSCLETGSGGCSICFSENAKQMFIKPKEDFINESKLKYPNQFNYEELNYDGAKININLTCMLHIPHYSFETTPDTHLNKATTCGGCMECRKLLLNTKFKKSNEKYIEESKEIHGNTYDYSVTDYINGHTNVRIICRKHGEFLIMAESHIYQKQGCQKCNPHGHSKSQISWLNFIQLKDNITIQHAENECEFVIPTTNFKADGYCQETNSIYEFHGDYWHGNPKVFDSQEYNKTTSCTYGELYKKTLEQEQQIKELGYNLVVMWENDWNRINKSIRTLQRKYKSKTF